MKFRMYVKMGWMVFTAGRGHGLPFIDHISYAVRDGPRRSLGFEFFLFL